MAALVLSVAGATLGGVFGPAGAIAGRLAGALAGSFIDRSLFGGDTHSEGPRLADLDVMASTEGAPVARIYGRARISGQLIWATRHEEVISERSGGGGKGLGASQSSTTTYSYFANFAIGLCDGEIGSVGRIWADGKPLDLAGLNFRVYRGDETQLPDALIVAKEGAGNAPAYRGLAYVVFERLPLADFGNRIPQLSFEVTRPLGRLEHMVRAVTLIPGTTEFGYEPSPVVRLVGPGQSLPENRHVFTAPSDIVASLDDLQAQCPNLESIAVIVAWFGTDLRAGHCEIKPGVDDETKQTSPLEWSVAGFSREDAYVVSKVSGRAAYGGTPSDESVRHLIAEIKARGLKVTLYPFVMMDIPADNGLSDPWTGAASQPVYPWRGRITCDPAPGRPGSPQGTATVATEVNSFFAGGFWNYRRLVLHYANLAASAGGVSAFLIGSELKALTRLRSAPGVYPAVDQLVTLAADVKAILGGGTIVTYGADWTEYGSDVVDDLASEVRFPLDKLWASPNIDVVGIDYYAPLADWRDGVMHADAAHFASTYDWNYLAGNVAGGEGFDWYYANDAARNAQTRLPITDGLGKPWTFRVKDLWNWWSNAHVERVAGAELPASTGWIPRGKPIWITEVGCPAVDRGANQPSVFPDPKSSESHLPYFSRGYRDDLIQRRYLEAFVGAFDPAFGADDAMNPVSPVYGGRMIDTAAIYLWTWDARPYPVFPAAEDQWSDGPNWRTGHWLTGRLGATTLDTLVAMILTDAGFTDFDTSDLRDICEGYVVDRPMSPRAMIDPLALAYAFDATAIAGKLTFAQRGRLPSLTIDENDLVEQPRSALAKLTRTQETELPREVSFGFTDLARDYRRAVVRSRRLAGNSNRLLHEDFAIVTESASAERRAEICLQDLWAGRERAEFAIGAQHAAVTPGDVVELTLGGRRRYFEIDEIVDTDSRAVKARSIDPEVFSLALKPQDPVTPALPAALGPAAIEVMSLPDLGIGEPVLTHLAVFAQPWPGSLTVWRAIGDASFTQLATAAAPSVAGTVLDPIGSGPTSRWDKANAFRVRLHGGVLTSVSDVALLDGANAAAVRHANGVWEVLQFANAVLEGPQTYRLSRLLRGQLGSEYALATDVPSGAPFVLLDSHVVPVARGVGAIERSMRLRVVASGRAHDDPSGVEIAVTPTNTALRPLAPVHAAARRHSDGIHLTWIRRTRRDGDGWAGEVPLGESSESYAVDIVDGASLKRRIVTSEPRAIYSIADELSDFGSAKTSLHVRIAQISGEVGDGFPLDTNLTV